MLAVNQINGFGAVEGDDGIDTYTVLLLHCNGADASTTLTDSSPSAKSFTANGNAQIDTASSKFGGASALFDGTGDWWDTADSDDFAFGSGEFTIDFWFSRNGGYGSQLYMCGVTDSAFNVNSDFAFGIRFGVSNEVVGQICSGTTTTSVTGTTAFSSSGWHHVAFLRTGNTLKLFLDGVQEGGDVSFSSTANNSTKKFAVGRCGEFANLYHNGWLDEFRISKGIARWTTNFTPPAFAYY